MTILLFNFMNTWALFWHLPKQAHQCLCIRMCICRLCTYTCVFAYRCISYIFIQTPCLLTTLISLWKTPPNVHLTASCLCCCFSWTCENEFKVHDLLEPLLGLSLRQLFLFSKVAFTSVLWFTWGRTKEENCCGWVLVRFVLAPTYYTLGSEVMQTDW